MVTLENARICRRQGARPDRAHSGRRSHDVSAETSCHDRVSRAYPGRMGRCILLMLPQLDQDLEQRPLSLQPADDS